MVISRQVKAHGWVCKYFVDKGFGFIASPINKDIKNVFFHISDVEGESICMDDNVNFTLMETPKGFKAVDIKIDNCDV